MSLCSCGGGGELRWFHQRGLSTKCDANKSHDEIVERELAAFKKRLSSMRIDTPPFCAPDELYDAYTAGTVVPLQAAKR